MAPVDAASAGATPTTNASSPPPLPLSTPSHAAALRRRHNLRWSRPSDRDRTLQILSLLLIYVIVVHYALKFATFLIPDDTISRDEMLLLREGNQRVVGGGRLGEPSVRGVLGYSFFVVPSPSASMLTKRRTLVSHRCGTTAGVVWSTVKSSDRCFDTTNSTVNHPIREVDIIDIGSTINEMEKSMVLKDMPSLPNITASTTAPIHKRPRIPILSYQNSYVIVSKPTGMTVHSNSNSHVRWGQAKKSPVLESIVQKQLCRKVYLVHRLDHRTSGACILGFTSDAAGRLHGRLRNDNATKLYIALVRGDLRSKFQCAARISTDNVDGIDLSINGDGSVMGCRDPIQANMSVMRDEEDADHSRGEEYYGKLSVKLPITTDGITKDAHTDVYFLSSMSTNAVVPDGKNERYSTTSSCDIPSLNNATYATSLPYITTSLTLLLCRPKTGRTHQIRKHLQRALNAPIIGDVQHGDSRVNRYWREHIGLDRLGLHCWYLELPPSDDNGGAGALEDEDDDNKIIQCMAPLTHDFIVPLRHEMLQCLWNEAIRFESRLSMEPYDERGGTFGRHYRKRA
ncbi:hypothetical protein ACHAWU_004854 [Discostella pseudostelligera]|uniref:Pseudouridine synthase RsuA/RluA-like domain-containing protein n=1 Tax=Discostella pseudostelligera TaxID=259834 RepID=A0ABD3M647_9STRA